MRRHAVFMLAGLFAGAASLASAACPPNQSCPSTPPPPKPAPPPPRPVIHPMVGQSVRVNQPPEPPVRNLAPPRISRPGPRPEGGAPPPHALMIHRDQNGYTRHYVGPAGGALGARPRRDTRGPTYLYHGRPYAPFRMGRYHWPQGQEYRRYHRHERFPRLFLIPEYFIDNYTDYDLAPPPPNAQWVRYGDDLVLVDLDTGDILNVVSGAFLDSDDGSGDASGDDGSPPSDSELPPDNGPPPDGAPSPN